MRERKQSNVERAKARGQTNEEKEVRGYCKRARGLEGKRKRSQEGKRIPAPLE
jgi:hypothetical protein